MLRTQAGKTYQAQVNFPDGSTKIIALPKAIDEGYILGVYQPGKDSLLVRIYASPAMQQSTLGLVAHTGGKCFCFSGKGNRTGNVYLA
ncbi:hypothetical protein [Mucilaginibacter antarcticus]|uniref:hypothetical protein n=1 Tax=Mucilaginibacter antarcticus TaxID=1855725 RepID=UPI00363F5ECE